MANLIFNVTDGNLSRVAPSEDGKIAVFMLLVDSEASPSTNAASIGEFFSLKDAQQYMVEYPALDNTESIIRVFENIYRENPVAHVYFHWLLADDGLDEFMPSQNNRIEGLIDYSQNTARLLLYHTNKYLSEDIVADVNARLENRFLTTQCGISSVIGAAVNAPIADPVSLEYPYVSIVYAKDSTDDSLASRFVGTLSRAKVHENAGWVQQFRLNVTEDVEFFLSETSQNLNQMTQAQYQSIANRGYIIPVRIPDYSGWYWNDSFTATSSESDFAYIENNRTMHKAIRRVRRGLLPYVNSPVYVGTDGKMRRDVVANLESAASKGLEQMQKDGEISTYDVLIDPEQDILSSNSISVVISIRPVGVARNITVTIGFTV